MDIKHQLRFRKGSEVDLDAATSFMSGPFFTLWYLFSYFVALCFFLMFFDLPHAWTLNLWIHFLAQFYLMHWAKGTPFSNTDQKALKHLTFFEQLDRGKPWTPIKKFLITFPVIVYIIGSHLNIHSKSYHFWNFPPTLILVLAKLPQFHKVRLFGINDKRWEAIE